MKHEFVKFIPDHIEEGTLYVSINFGTVVHNCCCGCGREVVTPLNPTDWKLTFNGETISLHPSIGNWDFPCQSHYWIRKSRIEWAGRWSQQEIDEGRRQDQRVKEQQYKKVDPIPTTEAEPKNGLQRRRKFWIARVLFGEFQNLDG